MTIWDFACPHCGAPVRLVQQQGEFLTFRARQVGLSCLHWAEPKEGLTTS